MMESGNIVGDFKEFKERVIKDISKAETVGDWMDVTLRAYYAVWMELDADKRKMADDMCKEVQTVARMLIAKREGGYIVEE